MHSCSAEVSYGRFAVAASAQDDNKTAGLIFSQEAPPMMGRGASLYKLSCECLRLRRLDVDFSAAHAVADSVAAVAVYDYSSLVVDVSPVAS